MEKYELDFEERNRIKDSLKKFDEPNSEERKRYEIRLRELEKLIEPLRKAIRMSETLTAKDYGIIVY